jgi:hypothetical protein
MRGTMGRGWIGRVGVAVGIAAGVAMAACSDGLSPPRGSAVRIYLGAAVFDEQTVGVDSVFALSAQVLDASGKAVPGEGVEWSSDRPDIVSVDGTGLVVAKAIGTADITARHRVGQDVARINVAEYVTGEVECFAGEELPLAPGEVRIFEGGEAVRLCLSGNTGGGEYAMIAVNTGRAAASTLPVNVRGTDVTGYSGPPNPSISALPTFAAEMTGDDRFHERIRAGSSRALESRLRSGAVAALSAGPSAQLSVGQLAAFNVSTEGSDGCSSITMRHGRVRRVTARAIIVADTMNPAGGFSDADFEEFGDFFDEHAWPLTTGTFGQPSDIDGNDRAIVFFTVAVNELPANNNLPQNSGSYVGGFFYNRDLFPRSSCGGSNAAEMFYMMVPDPLGEPEPGGRRSFGLNFVKQKVPTLLVHEFQHLVNDSRRLHVNQAPVWEETWLNEGLSHIAEELMFFHTAPGLETKQNLGPASFTETAQKEAFATFQRDNHDRFAIFIRNPDNASLLGSDLLSTRGAAWAFLRYAADRYAAGESALWTGLVTNSREAGMANLDRVLATDTREWMRDWAIALYADDTGLTSESRFLTSSWNYRAMFTQGQTLLLRANEPYPIRAPRLFSGQNRRLTLQGGGSGYLRVGVAAGGRAAVRVTVGATADGNQLPPPSRLKIAVMRTK